MKKGKLISYKTVQDNWEATAKNLRENYFNKGRKDLLSVNELYVSPMKMVNTHGIQEYMHVWRR